MYSIKWAGLHAQTATDAWRQGLFSLYLFFARASRSTFFSASAITIATTVTAVACLLIKWVQNTNIVMGSDQCPIGTGCDGHNIRVGWSQWHTNAIFASISNWSLSLPLSLASVSHKIISYIYIFTSPTQSTINTVHAQLKFDKSLPQQNPK